MRKEKRTVVVTIRLGESAVRALKALADADRRPFATFVAMIVEDYLAGQQHEGAGKSGRTRSKQWNPTTE